MRVRLELGELADQEVDAVVRLAPRGLVGRREDRLLTAAGPDVVALCRRLRGGQECEAIRTPAGRLRAKWLLHVVVPQYSIRRDRAYLLSTAYRGVLAAAAEVGAATLALPPLGTVHPYWPLDEAVRICLLTLYGTPTSVREARLVLSSPGAIEVFAEALARR